MVIGSALNAVSSALSWPGGLSQTDWFGLATGTVGCAAAGVTYNQTAYVGNCTMRQAQMYQEKNYHLGWVTIARDDIREMMNITVNRINNYMVVATLILGVAAGMLGVEWPPECPLYIKNNFWLSMGLSIFFFSLSIIFAVKGQNSAFLNTMRLLTWEMRPENPASYTHDYMQQAQQFERDGLAEMFRIPGVMPRYGRGDKKKSDLEEGGGDPRPKGSQEAGGAECTPPVGPAVAGYRPSGYFNSPPGSNDGKEVGPDRLKGATSERSGIGAVQGSLETLTPDTYQLLYLKRFSNYMSLWQPYDTQAKNCIGIGLISLCQCSAYYALGFLITDNDEYTSVVAVCVMIIFTSIGWQVYDQNFTRAPWWERVGIGILFAFGPGCAAINEILDRSSAALVLESLTSVGHGLGFLTVFLMSLGGGWKTVKQITEKYTTGPSGERFPESLDPSNAGFGGRDPRSTDPGLTNEQIHAARVREKVRAGVRGSLLLSALVWFTSAATILHYQLNLEESRPRARRALQAQPSDASVEHARRAASDAAAAPCDDTAGSGCGAAPERRGEALVATQRVPVSWPSALVSPRALACGGRHAFAANAYQVFRVPITGGATVLEPCSGLNAAKETIVDLTVGCDASACWPLVLLNGTESSGEVLDCSSGSRHALLQEPVPATKVALLPGAGSAAPAGGGALAATSLGKVVFFSWSQEALTWSPQWDVMDDAGPELSALDVDDQGRRLLLFERSGRLRIFGVGDARPAGAFATGTQLAGGCALEGGAALLMPVGKAPDLLRADLTSA